MNDEEMEKKITNIIKEAMDQISHSSCAYSESHCNKDSPDWEPRYIHCGTDRCRGLHKID